MYPKFQPNTVVPEYSCAMHAKYELMIKAIDANYFSTLHFAWIDIGLFRHEDSTKTSHFDIGLPPKFNQSLVAYNEVFPRLEIATSELIFTTNAVWVCGCFFIGQSRQMKLWAQAYMNYTEVSIAKGWMNTDQQVIYAMVNDRSFHRSVDLQVYGPGENWGEGKWDKWFHLGYLSRRFSH